MKFQIMKAVNVSIVVVALGVGGGSAAARDNDQDSDHASLRPRGAITAGCYDVTRGYMAESSADAKSTVGVYRLVLSDPQRSRPAYVFMGPLSGTEEVEEGGEPAAKKAAKAARVQAAEEEGPHGGHHFGTFDRLGTFSSAEDSIKVTSASCPNGEGKPQYIKGIETVKFSKGTGIFSNLVSGQIDFNLTYDACNNKNNPVSSLDVISGKMCFR